MVGSSAADQAANANAFNGTNANAFNGTLKNQSQSMTSIKLNVSLCC